MNVHKNARMTVHGRLLLVARVRELVARVREGGWRVEGAALAAGVSVRSTYKWLARHRAGGERRGAERRPIDGGFFGSPGLALRRVKRA